MYDALASAHKLLHVYFDTLHIALICIFLYPILHSQAGGVRMYILTPYALPSYVDSNTLLHIVEGVVHICRY